MIDYIINTIFFFYYFLYLYTFDTNFIIIIITLSFYKNNYCFKLIYHN